jgi:2-polyprenyl-3-methyl-5-hydroxy-6-metoxy-1,4-benzoquinol methylase
MRITSTLEENLKKAEKRWKQTGLPKSMKNLTFLNAGCWGGGLVKLAMEKNAKKVLGIDIIKSKKMHNIPFISIDIFSERFLALPTFDIVHCGGVIYHTENPVSLLRRLQIKTRKNLFIRSVLSTKNEEPVMRILSKNELDNNYSNWWLPNEKCLTAMLESTGFENIKKTHETKTNERSNTKVCTFIASPKNILSEKILPRKKELL